MKLTTTTLKRLVLIEQKKFSAESKLRHQIREHVKVLLEDDAAAAPAGLSEENKKSLNDLSKASPTDLKGFSEDLGKLVTLLGALDPAPVVESSALGPAYKSIFEIIAGFVNSVPATGAKPAPGTPPAGGAQQAKK